MEGCRATAGASGRSSPSPVRTALHAPPSSPPCHDPPAATGTTFLCTSNAMEELVAIKALDKHHPEFDRSLAMEELRILAAISDHPYIATLIGGC